MGEGSNQDYPGKPNKGTPPMGKEKSDKSSGDFIKGGTAGMSGPNHAGPQTPGGTGQGGAKNGAPHIKGGNAHMFGPQHANPQAPGVAGHTETGGSKFAEGGKTKMFGYTGSKTAKPA